MNRFHFCHYLIGETRTEDEWQQGDLLVVQNLSVGLHHNCLEMVKVDSYRRKCIRMFGGYATRWKLYPVFGQQQSDSGQAGRDVGLPTFDQVAQDAEMRVDFLKSKR